MDVRTLLDGGLLKGIAVMQGLWSRAVRLTHIVLDTKWMRIRQPYDNRWEAVVSFWMHLGPAPEQHVCCTGDELTRAGESATPSFMSGNPPAVKMAHSGIKDAHMGDLSCCNPAWPMLESGHDCKYQHPFHTSCADMQQSWGRLQNASVITRHIDNSFCRAVAGMEE